MGQKTSFQGLSLQEAKRVAFNSLVAESIISVKSVSKRGLEITARTAGTAKNIEVEVDKPLGLTLGPKKGGGVVITVSIVYLYIYIFYLHFVGMSIRLESLVPVSCF